jgi:D-alanine-D-alanine ligase
LPRGKILPIESFKKHFDIALPITHGKFGEDGILQGILESQKIRYCGCRVFSSSLCMDKAASKTYLSGQGIKQTKFAIIDYTLGSKEEIKKVLDNMKNKFQLPLFVKPANSGSSVGINQVKKIASLNSAIREARKHDSKIVIEEGLVGHREIEISMIGNNKLIVSVPGELVTPGGFYDFDNKYKLGNTEVIIPASISKKQSEEIKELAKKIYKLCFCSGFARLDFFMKNNKIYFNEINTLPGFTNISMFPKLFEKSGIAYKNLISKIIELAY